MRCCCGPASGCPLALSAIPGRCPTMRMKSRSGPVTPCLRLILRDALSSAWFSSHSARRNRRALPRSLLQVDVSDVSTRPGRPRLAERCMRSLPRLTIRNRTGGSPTPSTVHHNGPPQRSLISLTDERPDNRKSTTEPPEAGRGRRACRAAVTASAIALPGRITRAQAIPTVTYPTSHHDAI